MAKREDTQIQKVAGNPDYLAAYVADDTSTQALRDYVVVPRVKILQSMSSQELKKQHGEGSVVIMPGNALVCTLEQSFQFNPRLFWTEWCLWSDLRDEQSDAILARSYDPSSEIAKRAADKKMRYDVYPGHENKSERERWTKRYVQHLCFAGNIYGDHALAGTPCVVSFEKGEFFTGRNFISAISLRRMVIKVGDEERRVNVPLWAQVWTLKPAGGDNRKANGGSWFGFDFSPGVPPTIKESEAQEARANHLELAKLHEEQRLVVDAGGRDEEDTTPSDSKKF